MNTMRSIKKLLIFSLISVSILLTACAGTEPLPPTPSATMMPSATATVPLPTPTSTTAPTATTSPTETPETKAQVASSQGRVAFISETYPDNSVLEPGESFTKAYELRNAGSTTWSTDYALVRDETIPAGETLGSPERLPLPQAVAPGETLTLQISLVAPEEPSTYTVYWTLQDENGNILPVDGVQRVWVTIRVCEAGQDCSAPLAAAGGGSASVVNGVSFSLTGVSHEGPETHVGFCLSQVNPKFFYYSPDLQQTFLIVDGQELSSSSGSSTTPINGTCCMTFHFPLTLEEYNQAAHISFYTERIEGVNWSEQTCEEIRPSLITQYPGLDFECARYDYYTNLRLPAGLTREEAHQIVVDAIEDAKYGPWELIIK